MKVQKILQSIARKAKHYAAQVEKDAQRIMTKACVNERSRIKKQIRFKSSGKRGTRSKPGERPRTAGNKLNDSGLLKFYDTCEMEIILDLINQYNAADPPDISDKGEDFDIDRAALFYFTSQFIFKNADQKTHYLTSKSQQIYYDDDRKRNMLLHLQLAQNRISQTILTAKDWLDSYFPATNIFFDPPYEGTEKVYSEKSINISTAVRNWIIANLQPLERANIVISGYDKEHDDLLEFGFEKQSFVRFNIKGNPTAETIWYKQRRL